MLLSFVVPCYNEEEMLPEFVEELGKVTEQIVQEYKFDLEMIFVDDGSSDNTKQLLQKYSQHNDSVHYISFTRNFGKEAAILAGLRASKGDYILLIDCDLQDPPELVLDMVKKMMEEPCDCVAARRTNRQGEPVMRSFFAKMFYKINNATSDTKLVPGARDFRLMTRRMVNSILELSEVNRFSKGIFAWVGYDTKWIDYENKTRRVGKSKWKWSNLFSYGMDGLIDFSTKPLEMAAWMGMFFFILSIIGIIIVIIRKLTIGDPVAGWPSLVCIILFCSGIQLFCTGIIGAYLANMYIEVKKRPMYIIEESDFKNGEIEKNG